MSKNQNRKGKKAISWAKIGFLTNFIAVTDIKGKIVYFQLLDQEKLGISAKRISGQKIQSFLPKAARASDIMTREIIKKGWLEKEYKFLDKAGEDFWYWLTGFLIKDKQGEPWRIVIVVKNTSKYKKIEKLWRESKEECDREKARNEALLTSIGEGIIATDQNSRINLINSSAEEMLGWQAKDVLGKPIFDVIKIVDEKNQEIPLSTRPSKLGLLNHKKAIAPILATYYFVRKDKTRFPVGIISTPFVLAGKNIGAILVFRDITVEKEIDRAKTEFVSIASHQLRTPLSTINWYAEMLIDGDVGELTGEQKKYLQEIYDGNKRMTELVNALLDISRIEMGNFTIEPKLIDIIGAVENALKEFIPQVKKKNIKVRKNFLTKPLKLNADANLLHIIFQNLLSNAIKYTPVGGRVTVGIQKDGPDILITVADTGYGIAKKDYPKVFSKLFRADNVVERHTEGTGLGLYVVKSIIDQIKGKIWFDSKDKKGTIFYVTIPARGMYKRNGDVVIK